MTTMLAEHFARALAPTMNGGDWDADYTDAQKDLWIARATGMLKNLPFVTLGLSTTETRNVSDACFIQGLPARHKIELQFKEHNER